MIIKLDDNQAQLLYMLIRDYLEADASFKQTVEELDEHVLRHDDTAEMFEAYEQIKEERTMFAFAVADAVVNHIYNPLVK